MSRVVRSSRPVTLGVAGGLTHALAVGLLWEWFGFESLAGTASVEPLYVAYLLAGMLAVGVVPGVGYARRALVSPVVVVGALFVGTAGATWLRLHGGAVPVGPTPLGWYALLWPVTLVLAVSAGVGENRFA